MICPKCQNAMRTLDRLGVHIDQCESCRGIFLDRGELEQITAAERQHYAAAPPPYQPEGAPPPPHVAPPPPHVGGYGGGYADSPRGYRGGYADSPKHYGRGGYGHGRRKRRSFLEELFD